MTSLNGYSKLERQQGTQPEVRHFGHKHFKEDGNRQLYSTAFEYANLYG